MKSKHVKVDQNQEIEKLNKKIKQPIFLMFLTMPLPSSAFFYHGTSHTKITEMLSSVDSTLP